MKLKKLSPALKQLTRARVLFPTLICGALLLLSIGSQRLNSPAKPATALATGEVATTSSSDDGVTENSTSVALGSSRSTNGLPERPDDAGQRQQGNPARALRSFDSQSPEPTAQSENSERSGSPRLNASSRNHAAGGGDGSGGSGGAGGGSSASAKKGTSLPSGGSGMTPGGTSQASPPGVSGTTNVGTSHPDDANDPSAAVNPPVSHGAPSSADDQSWSGPIAPSASGVTTPNVPPSVAFPSGPPSSPESTTPSSSTAAEVFVIHPFSIPPLELTDLPTVPASYESAANNNPPPSGNDSHALAPPPEDNNNDRFLPEPPPLTPVPEASTYATLAGAGLLTLIIRRTLKKKSEVLRS